MPSVVVGLMGPSLGAGKLPDCTQVYLASYHFALGMVAPSRRTVTIAYTCLLPSAKTQGYRPLQSLIGFRYADPEHADTELRGWI